MLHLCTALGFTQDIKKRFSISWKIVFLIPSIHSEGSSMNFHWKPEENYQVFVSEGLSLYKGCHTQYPFADKRSESAHL